MYPTETCLFVFNYYQLSPYSGVTVCVNCCSYHLHSYPDLRNDIYVLELSIPCSVHHLVQLCDCSVIG